MAAPAKQTKHGTRRKGPDAGSRRKRGAAPADLPQGRPGKRGKQAKRSSRQALSRQVAEELLKLRPILKGIGAMLLDRLDGALAELAQSLDGVGVPGEPPVLPHALVLSDMLADIRALRLKPRKGRVKDLGRIEALLESVSARMPPGA